MPKLLSRISLHNQYGNVSSLLLVIVSVAVIFAGFKTVISHATGEYVVIKNTNSQCLDSSLALKKCNQTESQSWNVHLSNISHSNKCLTITSNNSLDLNTCDDSASQVWLKNGLAIFNPNSGKCINVNSDSKVSTAACSGSGSQTLSIVGTQPDCTTYMSGDRIACNAIQQWNAWQSSSSNHKALLNAYTDGSPYEEWCADFVSYIYKQSGYSFSKGETDGWDENNANNIVNMGFNTMPPSTYSPKTGDIGYFSYSGGHVEIVISGGKTPTFIYGNSGTYDPTTNNGQMAANTIQSDGDYGNLESYLTPNLTRL